MAAVLDKRVKIAHIADIHWRGGQSRHQEFKEAFQDFFEKAKKLQPDVVFVGGDIVHSKTQGISPELIDCLVWWFRELAEINPEGRVVVIPGNHDGILHNKDRQDVISPIITALNHSRISYYKRSGVYPSHIPGLNWCVFSCFDEEGWEHVKPVQDQINIALFHGSVFGSKTDLNHELEGEVNVSFFDGYDFGLLGDIHMRQFLTKDKRIGYSGSTLQNNFGESKNKGFLLWDIKSADDFEVEFHSIKNKKPFITIDWMGSVKDTLEAAKTVPSGARFRIKSKSPIHQTEIKQLHSELTITKKATEVVYKIDSEVDVESISTDSVSAFKENLYDPGTHTRLLREYLKEDSFTEEEWSQIEALVRNYIQIITGGEVIPRSTKWSIRRMKFDNTFGFGKDNYINFDNLNGLTGIFGRNASGKSSIVGTLVYSLFNTTDRGSLKNLHVINTRKGHCLTSVDFSVNGEHFRLERQTVKTEKKKGEVYAVTHLNIFSLDNDGNVIGDLSAEQRKDSEKVLRERIGTADDFMITSFCAQGDMNTFIKERSTNRKMILTKFLGLDIFEKMHRLARDESNSLKSMVEKVPERDWDGSIKEKRVRIKSLEDSDKMWERIIQEKRQTLQDKQINLGKMNLGDLITQSDVDRQTELLNSLEKSFERNKKELEAARESLKNIEDKKRELESLNAAIDIESLKKQLKSQKDLETSIMSIEHLLDKEKTNLYNQQKSVKILETVPCGGQGQFATCKFIKDSLKNKDKIDSQILAVDDLKDQLMIARKSMEDLKQLGIESKLSEHQSRLLKISSLSVEDSREKIKISTSEANVSKLITQIEKVKQLLEEMIPRVSATEIGHEADILKKEISALNSEISTLDGKRIAAATESGKHAADIDRLEQDKQEYQTIKSRWKIYERLSESFSHRGIPFQIITNQLPVINAEIAKILHGFAEFDITLESDEDSNAMDVYIDYGDSKRILELGSGMEKMMASLAIRVALTNVSSLPKPDMFIIDEGFGALDDLNIEPCLRLLESLKQYFKCILVISHVDLVKDYADNIIEITRSGKDSWVQHG